HRLEIWCFRSVCRNDLYLIANGLSQNEIWARKWLDACGKPSPGIYGGASIWPGSYELCLNNSLPSTMNHDLIRGRYCSVSFPIQLSNSHSANMSFFISLGVCAPQSCEISQLVNLINSDFPSLKVDATRSQCHWYADEVPRDSWFWIALTWCTVLSLWVLVGSIVERILYWGWSPNRQSRSSFESPVEIAHSDVGLLNDVPTETECNQLPSECDNHDNRAAYRESRMKQSWMLTVLCAYSIPYNVWILGHIGQTQNNRRRLHFLDGLRVLSIAWVILGHSILMPLSVSNNKVLASTKYFHSWAFQAVLSGTLAVDTFFFLSGLLASYSCLVRRDELQVASFASKVRIWGWFAFHRLIRLTPTYLFVLVCYTGFFFHFLNGPLFPQKLGQTDVGFCRDHWYLLYLNNLILPNQMCISWTWYLANDLQFTLILAPIFVCLIIRCWQYGLAFLVLLVCSAVISNYVLCLSIGCPAMPNSIDYFTQIYVKPYTRWSTYAIGLGVGWLLSQPSITLETPARRLRCNTLIFIPLLGLVLACGLCLSTVYGMYGIVSGVQVPLSPHMEAVQNSLSRTAFILGVAIVTWLCATGWIEPIRAFLSWPGFRMPARLTYTIYMVHPVVVMMIFLGQHTPILFNNLSIITGFLSVLFISMILAFIVSLTVELPPLTIEKYLIQI
ncbi:hypothetical protein AHF37_02915, partial [Paragonimus kellicotti]